MRILAILLGFLLLCSFLGNVALGYLGLTFYERAQTEQVANVRMQQTATLQARVIGTQTARGAQLQQDYAALDDDYRQLTAEYTARSDEHAVLQQTATAQAFDLNNYRDALATSEFYRGRAMCATLVEDAAVHFAQSNNDVRGAVIAVLEQLYDDVVLDTRIETLWNNSQSAVLTSTWITGTTKTIIAWDESGHIVSMYDIGMGCVLYAGDVAYQ